MQFEPIPLLLFAATVWRVSWLVTNEAGPRDIFGSLRYAAGNRFAEELGADGRPMLRPAEPGTLADLTSCVFCFSVWAGLVLAPFYFWSPGVFLTASSPLWASALALGVHRAVR